MTKKILIINGPNLNMLDKRDKNIYGGQSLEKAKNDCSSLAKELGLNVEFKQSNDEGEIITFIQQAVDSIDGIIINAAAYTHTSVAIRDALEIFTKPKIELHISNIYKREDFRKKSFISEVVDAVISGLGINGYSIALLGIDDLIKKTSKK
ncbi:MAG: type II 3-dehydroquinate dehydratase [Proteobacteria bacterium]|nr:type II 3-dehydroquinate dehydratase [Pseudomonadota bacterium]